MKCIANAPDIGAFAAYDVLVAGVQNLYMSRHASLSEPWRAGLGIRTRQRQLANGRIIGGGAFGVGGLAHLLRNRFYIGEVVYHGETFRGDHEPILDPALFAGAQAKISSQAIDRRRRIRGLALVNL
jgi:hypothetical protein